MGRRYTSGHLHGIYTWERILACSKEKYGDIYQVVSSLTKLSELPEVFSHERWRSYEHMNDSLKLPKFWLRECQDNHPECRQRDEAWLPTRLLKLDEVSNGIRLVETGKSIGIGDYVTLSHCWGKASLIKLTRENQHSLCSAIRVDELPRLYKETVSICRELGVRYLWIDSLCIVQDDDADWAHEAGLMGLVYRNALCNLEASCANDGNGRLVFRWDKPEMRQLALNFDPPLNGCTEWTAFNYSSVRANELVDAPLYKRAWVMQEQLLSPRSLLFGSTQMHWICRKTEASELLPLGVPDLRQGHELNSHSMTGPPIDYLKRWLVMEGVYRDNYERIGSPSILSPWDGFCAAWRALVFDYTSRSMTFEKDKLVALAGLASELERKLGEHYQYKAGMWITRFSIEYELCWTATTRRDGVKPYRPHVYRAPSWSWASIEGQIWWTYKEDWDLTGDTQLAFVHDKSDELCDDESTDPIQSHQLRIHGPFLEHPDGLAISVDDPRDDECAYGKLYTLTMFALYADQKVWGLALQRIECGDDKGCYKRIGTFTFVDDIREDGDLYDTFYGAPKVDIIVI